MDFLQSPAPAQPESEGLSPTGQMIGWAVFGSLVVTGFIFGVVTGYERPRPVVANLSKEGDTTKPDSTKPDNSKPAPKLTPEPSTIHPIAAPKDVPPPKPVVVKPRDDPKPSMPVVAKPKDDPKPTTPVTTVPKTDPPAKKEEFKAVSFKEVVPVLRTYCFNCHGAGKGKPRGDVDLTTVAKMMKSPGKILVPGEPDKSTLYTSITEGRMPDGGKPPPNKEELKLLRNWIGSGAKQRRRVGRRRGRA